MNPLRIGWFSTGRGPGSRALLRTVGEAIAGGLPVEIAYVFCNRAPGEDDNTDEFFGLVHSLNLPLVTLSSAGFRRQAGGKVVRKGDPLPRWRLDFDDRVLQLVEPFATDLGLLAGYMLIFGPAACERLLLLNLHPAVPGGPIGIWQDIVRQLIEARADRSGISIFRAVPEVDTGPSVSYCTYSLRGEGIDGLWERSSTPPHEQLWSPAAEETPLFQEIRRRGATREPPLIVETLRALAEGRADPSGEHPPLDLTAHVEVALSNSR